MLPSTVKVLARHFFRFKIMYIALFLIASGIYVLTHLSFLESATPEPASANYEYESYVADNDITLQVIKTNPKYIRLRRIDNNVTASGIVGVNGGFFWEKQLLSIAVQDDVPVGGEPGARESGWFNAKYARGTLVYDGRTQAYSVQVVGDASQLNVTDRSDYWAQGGVSLNLQDDAGWRMQADTQAIPAPDDNRLRSAMAYAEDGVYLIVANMGCTAEDFRKTIQSYGKSLPNRLIDGIFLDGDGSSQLLAREAKLMGDGRPVVQMIGVD
ncbi:hypothetical protein [Cohnella panacarvi]|uniref:hypothetical protein n=1 Tax=Cohnella panacarvi TaxID=400776 RepID=UPI00047A7C61|nr:hypothetical protein [Cohnella panacarvi]